MDPTLKFIPAPGTPLFPVSPERANQQKQSLHELPTSPSIGNLNSSTHARASSDVQSKVAQFNSLQKSVPDRQQAQDAASLKRAVLAREQAESNAWMLARQLEESRLERTKVAEQLERVKEQFERVTVWCQYLEALYCPRWLIRMVGYPGLIRERGPAGSKGSVQVVVRPRGIARGAQVDAGVP